MAVIKKKTTRAQNLETCPERIKPLSSEPTDQNRIAICWQDQGSVAATTQQL